MLDCIKENVKNWNDEGEVADFVTKILKKGSGRWFWSDLRQWDTLFIRSLTLDAVILKRKAFEMAKGKEIEAEFRAAVSGRTADTGTDEKSAWRG